MKVAVLNRTKESGSFRIYRDNLAPHLTALGVTLIPFPARGPVPGGCDLVWDPGLGMNRVPGVLGRVSGPLVVTVHGLRAFSLPLAELGRDWRERGNLLLSRWLRRREWARLRERVDRVITVSRYGAEEAADAFGLAHAKIRSVPHGVAHDIFQPEGARASWRCPYFLHVSANQTVKNVPRAIAAYQRLHEPRPDFVLILAGCRGPVRGGPGVTVLRRRQTPAELACWYRGATGLLLPSLRETFGMPILEAMACGCPVITADNGGGAEVAGDAALRVDPRSVGQISEAMCRLVEDGRLHAELRARGRARAALFTWRRSAREHVEVFREAVARRGPATGSRPA